MNRSLLIFILAAGTIMLQAQDLHLGFQWGAGSYRMDELREFNEYIESQNVLSARQIDDYPDYYYYKPSIHLRFSSLDLSRLLEN